MEKKVLWLGKSLMGCTTTYIFALQNPPLFAPLTPLLEPLTPLLESLTPAICASPQLLFCLREGGLMTGTITHGLYYHLDTKDKRHSFFFGHHRNGNKNHKREFSLNNLPVQYYICNYVWIQPYKISYIHLCISKIYPLYFFGLHAKSTTIYASHKNVYVVLYNVQIFHLSSGLKI